MRQRRKKTVSVVLAKAKAKKIKNESHKVFFGFKKLRNKRIVFVRVISYDSYTINYVN